VEHPDRIASDYYGQHAAELVAKYRSLPPATINGYWADEVLSRRSPGRACDIGAGSGRDAEWLLGLGWEVCAVEPNRALREAGNDASPAALRWVDDALPGLPRLQASGERFDLLLLAAVWMHLAPDLRTQALRSLASLLTPGGRLVITLRHGSDAAENRERGFHPVDGGELLHLAAPLDLALELRRRVPDAVRADLQWEALVFLAPGSTDPGQAA